VDKGERERRKLLNWLNVILHQSISTSKDVGDDGGEESNPEDSEMPWMCTLKVWRVSAGVGAGWRGVSEGGECWNRSAAGGAGQVIRVKVGAKAGQTKVSIEHGMNLARKIQLRGSRFCLMVIEMESSVDLQVMLIPSYQVDEIVGGWSIR
jgi:hypothetical protein